MSKTRHPDPAGSFPALVQVAGADVLRGLVAHDALDELVHACCYDDADLRNTQRYEPLQRCVLRTPPRLTPPPPLPTLGVRAWEWGLSNDAARTPIYL